jgi:hypothetical protein
LSIAKRYIYAGMTLLLLALLAALTASYTRPWDSSFTADLEVGQEGRQVVLASLLAGHGLPVEEVENLTIRLHASCGLQVLLHTGSGDRQLLLQPGVEAAANVTPLAVLYAEPRGGPCGLTLRVVAEGRSYPYRWLSLPALALMVAGSASLSLGAVLRLAGLEDT